MGKICKGIRANWTQDMMEEALRLIRKGKSQRYVEQACGIPRTTLRNHIKTGNSVRRLGRAGLLTNEQERQLEERILRLSTVGLPLTPKSVRRCVFRYCEDNNIQHKFKTDKELAGFTWYKSFLNRHPKLSQRKAQYMNPARAQKLNPVIVQDHFEKLGRVLDDLKLKNSPQRIYNLDEKGCRLTLHHNQSVLAAKGARRIHLISNEHAENTTIVACTNALGQAVPPMIIFKGVRLKETYKDNLPPGSTVQMAEKGSMTREIFVKWLQHFAQYKPLGNVLLILDGAACHLDLSIVDKATEYDIQLYCLPSNTTHELQPLDKAVFRAFEHYWDVELMRYYEENKCRDLKKERFGKVLNPVWQKTMTMSNIQSGFSSTGIYPFDPRVIPEVAFAPSTLTYKENPEEERMPLPPLPEQEEISSNEDTDDTDSEIPLSELSKKLKDNNNKSKSSFNESNQKHDKSTAKSSKINILNVTVIKPASGTKPQENGSSTSCSATSSFASLLPTPEFKTKQLNVQRKKSINYKAQVLKRDIFEKNKEGKSSTKKNKQDESSGNVTEKEKPQKESWFCLVCKEDYCADMRQCGKCSNWVHEMCVGLTKEDVDPFTCPACDD